MLLDRSISWRACSGVHEVRLRDGGGGLSELETGFLLVGRGAGDGGGGREGGGTGGSGGGADGAADGAAGGGF